jgi:hypothetical protein
MGKYCKACRFDLLFSITLAFVSNIFDGKEAFQINTVYFCTSNIRIIFCTTNYCYQVAEQWKSLIGDFLLIAYCYLLTDILVHVNYGFGLPLNFDY